MNLYQEVEVEEVFSDEQIEFFNELGIFDSASIVNEVKIGAEEWPSEVIEVNSLEEMCNFQQPEARYFSVSPFELLSAS